MRTAREVIGGLSRTVAARGAASNAQISVITCSTGSRDFGSFALKSSAPL